jgi:hypothetical protein
MSSTTDMRRVTVGFITKMLQARTSWCERNRGWCPAVRPKSHVPRLRGVVVNHDLGALHAQRLSGRDGNSRASNLYPSPCKQTTSWFQASRRPGVQASRRPRLAQQVRAAEDKNASPVVSRVSPARLPSGVQESITPSPPQSTPHPIAQHT